MRVETSLRGAGRWTVDLTVLREIFARRMRDVAPAALGALLSADACGLGARACASQLQAAGCRTFGVGLLGEALALKPYLAADAELLVLRGLLPGDEALCAAAGVTPLLTTPDQAARWMAFAREAGQPLPLLLQVADDASPFGLGPDAIAQLRAGAMPGQRVELCTLADGAGAGNDFPPTLRAAEQRLVRRADGRAGYAASVHDGDGVVRLEVAIAQTRELQAGDGVGYGATFVAPGPMRIATISAGYADGLRRSLSQRGAVYSGGVRLAFLGRVSMDTVGVDISALPRGALGAGDFVEVIGPQQSLAQLAAEGGVEASDILANLGRRYRRAYLI